ncbi:retrovirus-related pol polyprotein from transposon TNT 1-94 [Tanacetum coccineum]
MSLTFQPHSPKERPGLGIMKHTKLETHDSLNKSVSGTVTVSETELTTPSVPTEVKNTKQESKINKLTKLNFSFPYTPEQNGKAEKKNKTLIEAARTMLNGSILSKHFWTEAVRIACYTQNISIIIKRHDKTPYEIFRERILDISYIKCLDAPSFGVFNIRGQQVKETYHVTFDEIMEAIRFTNTSEDEIGIDDSSRYPSDEFIHEDDPSRQYQANFDISYYVILHGPPDLINAEGTHEQNVQNEQIITQPTEGPSGNNTEVLVSISKSLVPDVPQSHISNQASTSSHHIPQDRWSKD